MEQLMKDKLVRIFTNNLGKETANQLIELYGSFIEKITWEKEYKETYFSQDILKAHEERVAPEDWFKRAKNMEDTMLNPVPNQDYYRLKELLTDFGVGFKVEKKTPSDSFALVLETRQDKISGYSGFKSEYVFDANGKFVEIGIWE